MVHAKHSKFRILALQIAAAVLAVVSVVPNTPADERPSSKIGVIVALSGPLAPVGNSIRNAIVLAQQQLDPSKRVEFIFEDDQFQSKLGVSAAEKLISRDKVDALITFSGAVSAAIADIAERRKVPMLAITSLSSVGHSKQFVYSIFMAAKQQAAIISRAITQAGFQRVAIVTTEQDAMLELRDFLLERLKETVVSNEALLPGDTNLSSINTRIRAQKPDVVVNLTLPPQISILSRQLREQNFTGQFIGGPPLYNPPEILAANGALVGAWLPGPSSTNTAEFFKRYRAIFEESCISEGVYGYDAAAILIAGSHSGNIASYLKAAKSVAGLAGEYPKSDRNAFEVPVELKQVTVEATLIRAPASGR